MVEAVLAFFFLPTARNGANKGSPEPATQGSAAA
jgi:hypothetical protein